RILGAHRPDQMVHGDTRHRSPRHRRDGLPDAGDLGHTARLSGSGSCSDDEYTGNVMMNNTETAPTAHPTPEAQPTRISGIGRVLVAVYGVLALAATGRSFVQIVGKFSE